MVAEHRMSDTLWRSANASYRCRCVLKKLVILKPFGNSRSCLRKLYNVRREREAEKRPATGLTAWFAVNLPFSMINFSMPDPAFSNLSQAVLAGNAPAVVEEVNRLLAENSSPQSIMDKHLIPAMEEAGRLFEESEFFVPDLMIAANAMKEAMKILNPLLKNAGTTKLGRVVIGTVQGDMHDIGKNLVAAMLEGGGFEVVDLGVNVSPEKFVDAAREKDGTIICLSALLTTTMPMMKKVIEKLESEGIRSNYRVMIGGAPVTDDYARKIGADGYSDNAGAAVTLAKTF